MSEYSPVDWTFDLFPDHHKYLTFLKKVFRHEFRKNWFRRISTPVVEKKLSKKYFIFSENLSLSTIYWY